MDLETNGRIRSNEIDGKDDSPTTVFDQLTPSTLYNITITPKGLTSSGPAVKITEKTGMDCVVSI